MATISEVDLHNEASDVLNIPGMTLELLEHKAEHYTRRLGQLQETRAPISVIEPVARLQRRYSLALQMKQKSQELAMNRPVLVGV